jgi:hypothetical protein
LRRRTAEARRSGELGNVAIDPVTLNIHTVLKYFEYIANLRYFYIQQSEVIPSLVTQIDVVDSDSEVCEEFFKFRSIVMRRKTCNVESGNVETFSLFYFGS